MGYLTEKERYQIEAWLLDKVPVSEIAKRLDRCPATIYNEIHRGTVEFIDYKFLRPYKKYCADVGQRKQEEAAVHKGVSCKASDDLKLLNYVSSLIIDQRLSPYCVSLMLQRSDFSVKLCEKSIYNYIRRGLIPGVTFKSLAYLPRKKKRDQVRRLPRKKDCPSISDRDPAVMQRDDFGHWEMDTVYSGKGCSNACLLVLTERKTRHELLFKMPDRTCLSTVKCLDKLERRLGRKSFKEIFKTITVDNGAEFMDYEGITKHNRTKLFYCHPFCSGERGSNENQNKLIRRWIPKGDDIGLYSDHEIRLIQDWINALPRKLFNGCSSGELLNLHKKCSRLVT